MSHKTSVKASKAAEPKPLRTGLFASPASIVLGLGGVLFVAYVFDFQGLQTGLDGYFNGLDHGVRSHTSEITRMFLFVLPFAAILLGGGIVYILLSALGAAVTAPFKERRKKKAKALLKQAKAAAQPAGSATALAREEMVLVRPVRLTRKDVGVEITAKR